MAKLVYGLNQSLDAITPLGAEMLDNVGPLWLWVAKSVGRFQDARRFRWALDVSLRL
jgi:hypothetical protein